MFPSAYSWSAFFVGFGCILLYCALQCHGRRLYITLFLVRTFLWIIAIPTYQMPACKFHWLSQPCRHCNVQFEYQTPSTDHSTFQRSKKKNKINKLTLPCMNYFPTLRYSLCLQVAIVVLLANLKIKYLPALFIILFRSVKMSISLYFCTRRPFWVLLSPEICYK